MRRGMVNMAIVALVGLVAGSIALVLCTQPAAAMESEWTWKVYPSDRVNCEALQRMALAKMRDKFVEAIELMRAKAEEASYEELYYEPYYETSYAPGYSGYDNDFKSQGVVYDGGTKYTWYSQRRLAGGGLTELNSNGRTVNSDGFVVDGDGYIAVAQPGMENPDIGMVVDTPFGPGKVYDSNPCGDSWDIYTDF